MYEASLTFYVVHFITKQMQLHPEKFFFAETHFSLYTISGGPGGGQNLKRIIFGIFSVNCIPNGIPIHPGRSTFPEKPHFEPPYPSM